jgi:hypothetical protein
LVTAYLGDVLFVVVLAVILLGPFVWLIVQSIRHRSFGAPKHDDMLESEAMIQFMKDMGDVRTGGRGLS